MPALPGPDFRPRYHELHRVGRPGIWRSIVGTLALVALVFVVGPALVATLVLGMLLATGDTLDGAIRHLDVTQEVTPVGLAVLNVSLAAGIPAAWLVTWAFHRLKPRWLSSVGPFIRWKYFLVCLALSVVALAVALGVGMVVPQPDDTPIIGELNQFTPQVRDFLLVIVLLTPLQAAGEEYLFRGYLMQAFGSVTARRNVATALAILGPAILFALAHGSQSVPVFFDRFAFGIVAGILVLRTGGLEAAIAMHVLNNFVAFGLALAFGDMTETLNATLPSSWWMIASTLAQSLTYLALAIWVAKVMGVNDRGPAVGAAVPGAVLEPPSQRV